MSTPISIQDLSDRIGDSIGTSDWVTVDQSMVDQFADVTRDHQFIHVDPARARSETPFDGTIAHGFLTLSLLSYFSNQIRPTLQNTVMGINYGFEKIRFLNPVVTGQRVRGEYTLTSVEPRNDSQVLTSYAVTVEIENQEKPALVAEWLNLTVVSS